jgi:hypothetical protein
MDSRFVGFSPARHVRCSDAAHGCCAFTQGLDLLAESVRTEVTSLRTASDRNRYARLRLHNSTQGIGIVCAATHCGRIRALLSCRVLEISSPCKWRAQGNRRITGRRSGSTPLHKRPSHSASTARDRRKPHLGSLRILQPRTCLKSRRREKAVVEPKQNPKQPIEPNEQDLLNPLNPMNPLNQ